MENRWWCFCCATLRHPAIVRVADSAGRGAARPHPSRSKRIPRRSENGPGSSHFDASVAERSNSGPCCVKLAAVASKPSMSESKTYPPPSEFASRAQVKSIEEYRELYDRARENPEKFWSELALEELSWFRPFSKGLEWDPPFAKWFTGGRINACYNCVDRHASGARRTKPAILWEGEPGDQRIITYEELHRLVSRFATVLKRRGYKSGDRAIIYMP